MTPTRSLDHGLEPVYAAIKGLAVADEKRETALVRCEGCQEMVRPVTKHAVSLVAASVVTVHACPSCGGQEVSVASPSAR